MSYKILDTKTGKFWLAFMFLTMFFSVEITAQEKKLVETVDILGNRLNKDQDLFKFVKIRSGEVFNESQVQADLQSLLKTEMFDPRSTKVFSEPGRGGGINVIFQVHELPLIAKLEINGLKASEENQIYGLLKKQLNLQAGKPFVVYKVQNAKQIIERHLIKKGFSSVEISIQEMEVSATSIKLIFQIEAEKGVQFLKVDVRK